MASDEKSVKMKLHLHLQGYKEQALSYETVKDLMSFVFETVDDPNISWVSQDSHIRLLNGIFKRIGQTIDDKCIASIEESICSAFVFHGQNEIYNNSGKLVKTGRANETSEKPAPATLPDASALKENGAGLTETDFQRLFQELVTFENRIARTVESASLESREAVKRNAHSRIELESRLAIERAELTSTLSKERVELISGFSKELAGHEQHMEKERVELQGLLARFLGDQQAKASKAEKALDERMQTLKSALKSALDNAKDNSEAILSEQTAKHDAGFKKTEDLLDVRLKNLEQKLQGLEEKAAAGRKTLRWMNTAVVLGLILMAAGFLALYFLK